MQKPTLDTPYAHLQPANPCLDLSVGWLIVISVYDNALPSHPAQIARAYYRL